MTCKSLIFVTTLAISVPGFAHANGTPETTVQAIADNQQLVSYADLDLSDRSGQRTLNRRIMRASEELCIRTEGKFNVDKHLGGKENSCAARTYRQSQNQVAAAIARAERGEQHPSMAVVVSLEESVR